MLVSFFTMASWRKSQTKCCESDRICACIPTTDHWPNIRGLWVILELSPINFNGRLDNKKSRCQVCASGSDRHPEGTSNWNLSWFETTSWNWFLVKDHYGSWYYGYDLKTNQKFSQWKSSLSPRRNREYFDGEKVVI